MAGYWQAAGRLKAAVETAKHIFLLLFYIVGIESAGDPSFHICQQL
jgi:hypothetical protein